MMTGLLYKLRLVIEFEYTFDLTSDSLINLLTNETLDNKISRINKVFASDWPLTSKDFKLNGNVFRIEKKGLMNPQSARGLIIGEIVSNDSKTKIIGKVSSNYKGLYFMIFAIFFIGILWAPFFYFGTVGFEWVLIGIGFILLMVIQGIFSYRYYAKKLKRDFDLFLDRLRKK